MLKYFCCGENPFPDKKEVSNIIRRSASCVNDSYYHLENNDFCRGKAGDW